MFLECALLLIYALGITGLRRLPREMGVLFVSLIFYFVLVSGMPGAVARYRAPFMPLVCVAAGTFLARHAAPKVAHQTA